MGATTAVVVITTNLNANASRIVNPKSLKFIVKLDLNLRSNLVFH